MRALVTGGAGFIGSNLVDALIARGDDVVVLDDLSTGFIENVNSAAEMMEGDVADPRAVADAASGCDLVFHQAARRAVLRSVEDPLDTDRVNVRGTLAVLVAARDAKVRRVVFASSSSVYGGADVRPTPESTPLVPRSPYAVSKLAGEEYARVFWELFRLETVGLRYFNVFGPRQRPDSQYAAVIPLFIDALKNARPVSVHGDGEQSRHFAYISDAVAANLLAAAAPAGACAGRVYNIAGRRSYTLLELVGFLEDALGVEADRVHTDPRAGDVRHSLADLSSARADLGYEPAVEFDTGLRDAIAWFDRA